MHCFFSFALFLSLQAPINLWQRGSTWCSQPSPKNSQDLMNALHLMTSQARMSGQCKSPSTVRARLSHSGYIGHQRVGGCRVKLTLSEDSWGHNFNLKKQSYENIWLVFFCFPDPPFISKARSTGTSVGQKGILQCEASAVPRADFEWYKEDRRHVSSLSSMISTCSELFDLSITGLQTHVFCCTLWS